jgi:hypothetical protein
VLPVLWLPGLDQELADYREEGSTLAGRFGTLILGMHACYFSARTEAGPARFLVARRTKSNLHWSVTSRQREGEHGRREQRSSSQNYLSLDWLPLRSPFQCSYSPLLFSTKILGAASGEIRSISDGLATEIWLVRLPMLQCTLLYQRKITIDSKGSVIFAHMSIVWAQIFLSPFYLALLSNLIR